MAIVKNRVKNVENNNWFIIICLMKIIIIMTKIIAKDNSPLAMILSYIAHKSIFKIMAFAPSMVVPNYLYGMEKPADLQYYINFPAGYHPNYILLLQGQEPDQNKR